MKINVLFSPLNADELYFTGKTVIVIDILRATSVITEALKNGAKEIIPVGTLEFAMKMSGNLFGSHTLLGGERNTKKIEGFNLGNSPLEYSQDVVAGKSIILFTTNGSKAIVKAKFSENLFICSFNNIAAVANHLLKIDKDFEIICAGYNGKFCIEDSACAGRLITEITKVKENTELTDSTRAAVVINKSFAKNVRKMLSESEHGKRLIENGFEDDIKHCSSLNTTDVIPHVKQGVIKTMDQN